MALHKEDLVEKCRNIETMLFIKNLNTDIIANSKLLREIGFLSYAKNLVTKGLLSQTVEDPARKSHIYTLNSESIAYLQEHNCTDIGQTGTSKLPQEYLRI